MWVISACCLGCRVFQYALGAKVQYVEVALRVDVGIGRVRVFVRANPKFTDGFYKFSLFVEVQDAFLFQIEHIDFVVVKQQFVNAVQQCFIAGFQRHEPQPRRFWESCRRFVQLDLEAGVFVFGLGLLRAATMKK